jgi:hypothetical protein
MAETMTEPKQFYFDDLVKGNILSFLPTKEYFKKGTFYNKIFFFDDDTFRISEEYYTITIMKITKCYIYFLIELQPDIDPFIIQKKKKKKDDKGDYVKFIANDEKKQNEKILAMNIEFFHGSDVLRPEFLIKHNNM